MTIGIECPACAAYYEVDNRLVRTNGMRVKCQRCEHTWYFTPPVGHAELTETKKPEEDQVLSSYASVPSESKEDTSLSSVPFDSQVSITPHPDSIDPPKQADDPARDEGAVAEEEDFLINSYARSQQEESASQEEDERSSGIYEDVSYNSYNEEPPSYESYADTYPEPGSNDPFSEHRQSLYQMGENKNKQDESPSIVYGSSSQEHLEDTSLPFPTPDLTEAPDLTENQTFQNVPHLSEPVPHEEDEEPEENKENKDEEKENKSEDKDNKEEEDKKAVEDQEDIEEISDDVLVNRLFSDADDDKNENTEDDLNEISDDENNKNEDVKKIDVDEIDKDGVSKNNNAITDSNDNPVSDFIKSTETSEGPSNGEKNTKYAIGSSNIREAKMPLGRKSKKNLLSGGNAFLLFLSAILFVLLCLVLFLPKKIITLVKKTPYAISREIMSIPVLHLAARQDSKPCPICSLPKPVIPIHKESKKVISTRKENAPKTYEKRKHEPLKSSNIKIKNNKGNVVKNQRQNIILPEKKNIFNNIKLRNIAYDLHKNNQNTGPVLTVSGQVFNNGHKARKLPDLLVILLGHNKKIISSNAIPMDNYVLEPKRIVNFTTTFSHPSSATEVINIHFKYKK